MDSKKESVRRIVPQNAFVIVHVLVVRFANLLGPSCLVDRTGIRDGPRREEWAKRKGRRSRRSQARGMAGVEAEAGGKRGPATFGEEWGGGVHPGRELAGQPLDRYRYANTRVVYTWYIAGLTDTLRGLRADLVGSFSRMYVHTPSQRRRSSHPHEITGASCRQQGDPDPAPDSICLAAR